MKAIQILQDRSEGRPVDRVETALKSENMEWCVADQFAKWLVEQMPQHVKSDIDSKGRMFTTIAREYAATAGLAAATEHYTIAFYKVRMLALLHIEAVGFGKNGRNAHRAHMRELLRLCHKHVADERDKSTKPGMTSLYRVLGTA